MGRIQAVFGSVHNAVRISAPGDDMEAAALAEWMLQDDEDDLADKYVLMCVCVCVCVCVLMCVSTCAPCMYVCVCVCACVVNMHPLLNNHSLNACTGLRMHAWCVCVCVSVCVCARARRAAPMKKARKVDTAADPAHGATAKRGGGKGSRDRVASTGRGGKRGKAGMQGAVGATAGTDAVLDAREAAAARGRGGRAGGGKGRGGTAGRGRGKKH